MSNNILFLNIIFMYNFWYSYFSHKEKITYFVPYAFVMNGSHLCTKTVWLCYKVNLGYDVEFVVTRSFRNSCMELAVTVWHTTGLKRFVYNIVKSYSCFCKHVVSLLDLPYFKGPRKNEYAWPFGLLSQVQSWPKLVVSLGWEGKLQVHLPLNKVKLVLCETCDVACA